MQEPIARAIDVRKFIEAVDEEAERLRILAQFPNADRERLEAQATAIERCGKDWAKAMIRGDFKVIPCNEKEPILRGVFSYSGKKQESEG